MKTKPARFQGETADEPPFRAVIREGLKELAAIHKENKAADAEIRRLQTSTRKKLDRIRQNLQYVQAGR